MSKWMIDANPKSSKTGVYRIKTETPGYGITCLKIKHARLIAAAPELLSACRSALADVFSEEEPEHTLSIRTLELLKKAIAKVEGSKNE